MVNNANDIKFRASSIGHIMTEPHGKSNIDKYIDCLDAIGKAKRMYDDFKNKETKTAKEKLKAIYNLEKKSEELKLVKDDVLLSDSCKTHLVDLFVSNKYNRYTEIHAKQLDKGNEVEDDSITMLSLLSGIFYKKNEQHFENDFIKGTPDILWGDNVAIFIEVVIDTKSSWDAYSFFRATYKELNPMYYWQLMSYMDLTGAQSGSIDYCLNNTPYFLVESELRKESYNHPDNNTPAWIELQIIANHTYDLKSFEDYYKRRGCLPVDELAHITVAGFIEIPLEERHFSFKVERNDEDIERIHQRVTQCREYMNKNLFKI